MKVFRVTIWMLLALTSLRVRAQGWPLPLFSSDPQQVLQAAKQAQGPRDTPAYIIDMEMTIRVEESGKAHWMQRTVTRVVDDRGVRMFGTMVVPWVGWRQERPRIRARVITRDGRATSSTPQPSPTAASRTATASFSPIRAPFPLLCPACKAIR